MPETERSTDAQQQAPSRKMGIVVALACVALTVTTPLLLLWWFDPPIEMIEKSIRAKIDPIKAYSTQALPAYLSPFARGVCNIVIFALDTVLVLAPFLVSGGLSYLLLIVPYVSWKSRHSNHAKTTAQRSHLLGGG